MTETLRENDPEVDGIIACSHIVAVSTYKILQKNQISVPDQIQLIGFDDIDLSGLFSPELTTIRQPIRSMAEKAMELMIRGKNSEPRGAESVVLVSLTIRETTKRRERSLKPAGIP